MYRPKYFLILSLVLEESDIHFLSKDDDDDPCKVTGKVYLY